MEFTERGDILQCLPSHNRLWSLLHNDSPLGLCQPRNNPYWPFTLHRSSLSLNSIRIKKWSSKGNETDDWCWEFWLRVSCKGIERSEGCSQGCQRQGSYQSRWILCCSRLFESLKRLLKATHNKLWNCKMPFHSPYWMGKSDVWAKY